jgi:hypothetical protein
MAAEEGLTLLLKSQVAPLDRTGRSIRLIWLSAIREAPLPPPFQLPFHHEKLRAAAPASEPRRGLLCCMEVLLRLSGSRGVRRSICGSRD